MINAIKQISIFVLIFAVGSVISQQNMSQFVNAGSSESGSNTFCQELTKGSISNPSAEVDPLFEHASKSNANDAQPKTITSCNSLLNILPTENDFTFNPGEQEFNITIYNALLSSQTFVFQEPDPPRLG